MEIKNDNHILNIDQITDYEKGLEPKIDNITDFGKGIFLNQLTEKIGLHMKMQWHIINGTMKAK